MHTVPAELGGGRCSIELVERAEMGPSDGFVDIG
jgi:hypothetical protein